jgi:hypothetical protein
MDHGFYRSLHYWQQGDFWDRKEWSFCELGDHYTPRTFHEPNSTVLIGGDCRGKLTLQNGGLAQIYGDLSSTVEIGDQGEVVVGGNLMPGAAIEADGIHHIFIRGDLNGTIRSPGSLHIWICGNFGGEIQTGDPSATIYVAGDVSGQIAPLAGASLLYLDVDGYVPYEILRATAAHGYTDFNASIGFSDQPPGIYPPDFAERASHCHDCRWTIHRTRESTWNVPPDLGPNLPGSI